MTTLITGGTGTLGRQVVRLLPDARVLSRKTGGDLLTGAGVDDAVAGADVVVHCATTLGAKDVAATTTLVEAVKRAGSAHLVYISIVGVDRVPLGYYRAKLAAERVVESSGLPHTVLRATQFHDLIARVFAAQRFSPVLLYPSIPFQPIDTATVAARLAELAAGPARGRVTDLGGPRVEPARDLAAQYRSARGSRKPMAPLRLPGGIFGAYRRGDHTCPDHAEGTVTFADWVAAAGS